MLSLLLSEHSFAEVYGHWLLVSKNILNVTYYIKIVFVKVMEMLIKAFSNFQGHGCSWTSQGDNSELWQGNVGFELSNEFI